MAHPVYGIGTSALVYIGDEVSDRADGIVIGTVEIISRTGAGTKVRVAGLLMEDGWWYDAAELCLVKRAEP